MSFSATYGYDLLGRLTGASYQDGSSISYSYDELGNRTAVTQTLTSAFKYNIITKSGSFDANDGSQSYYRVTSSSTVTLPVSSADGAFMKIKVIGGTSTLVCSGSEHIFMADGSQVTTLSMDSTFGVIELVSVSAGYLVT